MASERVEALELAIAAWVGAVPRTTKAGQSPEGTRMAWVEALVGVVIGVEAGLSGMAAALMGTMKAVTIG
jgi:hypothetical protein